MWYVLPAQDPVEDTKGNNGDQGDLRISNLRLVWISKKTRKTNITIGFNCVTAISIREANSRLKGAHACGARVVAGMRRACWVHGCWHGMRHACMLVHAARGGESVLQGHEALASVAQRTVRPNRA